MGIGADKARRVVVVGGGLVGLSVARALARAGAGVTVVERGVPGAEASWAAGGILSPQAECDVDGPMLRLCRRGLADMRALERELAAEQGGGHDAGIGWRTAGTLDVATTPAEAATLAARVAWQQAAGLQAAWLAGAAVRARAPVGGDVIGGAWFADEASVEPRRLFEQLRANAQRAGVHFLGGRRVRRVEADAVELDRDLEGALDAGVAGERIEGDAVVVCAGAWTPRVAGVGVADDAVFPVRGVMVEIDGGDVGRSFDAVVYGHGGYAVPRRDGRVLIGSTMERAGFDKTITAGALASVLRRAVTLLPGLAERPVKSHWAGLRPGTADGLPLLGRSTTGVWIASGHFRNGVLLAAASGALLRDAILHDAPLDAAFAPDRFAR
ncbi:MAG: glycine oxidase ThiO [Deltaproteobacteria bacterium]|nr:glycine oxidase ThiO [Deltaproteobacteria bacterium]